ncbi:tRNA pseudouridine(55) synthase TruB [Helicobacter sp. 11S02596-1]|uniref:tRNA pseudouridine(55) synthase TruB n=1 Tax=Helicobacter sp. 11S02596-1 TaxID=1476194 RepID=UPI000BA70F55|nr:tRNA pseudouridine(55) synthase TruB [Helicobacter sp. 11S02596-1]PAF44498.1 tRNA pseudouridine(55) synthase TruB [Helicobacter sp. 11S02596-1]
MNALMVAYKPAQISCNHFLQRLKRTYGVKKAGYSGTLDPFARGSLIVGFGNYTRLFSHLSKTPKVYEATLWLGAESLSLDTENIVSISVIKAFEESQIEDVLASLKGEITYTPPAYSAKKIRGKRSYELARAGLEVVLPEVKMQIFDLELLAYNHPYISFRISVSEGAYVRSVGKMIGDSLGVTASLSSLERISEGAMRGKIGELIAVDVLEALKYPVISDFSDEICQNLWLGRKFSIPNQKPGRYIANFEDFFSIIEIKEDKSIEYLLNRMGKKC